LSDAGTPAETKAACTAFSIVVLKALDFGLRTVSVTSGMMTPQVHNC
jgi:hypothetical protein